MNLQRITPSAVFTPLLTRYGLALSPLARCVNEKLTVNGGGKTYECGNPVHEADGYADLEGAPFKAYYCPACAAALGAQSTTQPPAAPTLPLKS